MRRNNLLVDSAPSKEFFVDMITKDVTVESCILDLIDNSIDAHKRTKKLNESSVIEINYDLVKDYFQIIDNCGGMSKEDALSKAFKFGNPTIRDSHSLGMYGIGMKRSIFKIGKNFEVRSKKGEDSYRVFMNLDEWMSLKSEKDEEIWKFHIEDIENNFEEGVHIHIEKLSESIKNYLKWANNIELLKRKIGNAYREQLSNNITIKVNGKTVIFTQDTLFYSDILDVYVKTISLKNVDIKIISGISDAKPREAGWNIICNGRQIIEYNRTELTGWEADYDVEDDDTFDELLDKKRVPAYHNDFSRFRGYVIMTSEDPNNLPLNTTKDGIDKQHPIYRAVRNEMVEAMEIILPKLRELQKVIRECNKEMKVSPEHAFKSKYVTDYFAYHKNSFKLNLNEYKAPAETKGVTMQIEKKKLIELKEYFEVETNKDLGKEILKFVLERVIFDE